MFNLDSYPIPNANVTGRILKGEAVLVLAEEGKVKVLNEVGARIWTLADGKRTIRDIAAFICEEYEVTETQAEADALEFIDELIRKKVFHLSPHPTPDNPASK